MSDFEAGMLVGVLAGVWAMVAFEKLLSHWLKVRVVAVDKKTEPCDPADQGDTLGADAVSAKPASKVVCCLCKGRGQHQNFDRRKYQGVLPPPKKP